MRRREIHPVAARTLPTLAAALIFIVTASAGATEPFAGGPPAGARPARGAPAGRIRPGFIVTEEERIFWSSRPVKRPPIPNVTHANLVRSPIDAFLLQQLENKGLSFAAEA